MIAAWVCFQFLFLSAAQRSGIGIRANERSVLLPGNTGISRGSGHLPAEADGARNNRLRYEAIVGDPYCIGAGQTWNHGSVRWCLGYESGMCVEQRFRLLRQRARQLVGRKQQPGGDAGCPVLEIVSQCMERDAGWNEEKRRTERSRVTHAGARSVCVCVSVCVFQKRQFRCTPLDLETPQVLYVRPVCFESKTSYRQRRSCWLVVCQVTFWALEATAIWHET